MSRPKLDDLTGVYSRRALLVEDHHLLQRGLLASSDEYLSDFAIFLAPNIHTLNSFSANFFSVAIVDPGLQGDNQSFEMRLDVVERVQSLLTPEASKIVLTGHADPIEKAHFEKSGWTYMDKSLATISHLIKQLKGKFDDLEYNYIDFYSQDTFPYLTMLNLDENRILNKFLQNPRSKNRYLAAELEMDSREFSIMLHNINRKISLFNRRKGSVD